MEQEEFWGTPLLSIVLVMSGVVKLPQGLLLGPAVGAFSSSFTTLMWLMRRQCGGPRPTCLPCRPNSPSSAAWENRASDPAVVFCLGQGFEFVGPWSFQMRESSTCQTHLYLSHTPVYLPGSPARSHPAVPGPHSQTWKVTTQAPPPPRNLPRYLPPSFPTSCACQPTLHLSPSHTPTCSYHTPSHL